MAVGTDMAPRANAVSAMFQRIKAVHRPFPASTDMPTSRTRNAIVYQWPKANTHTLHLL